jgi:hypothetical protein
MHCMENGLHSIHSRYSMFPWSEEPTVCILFIQNRMPPLCKTRMQQYKNLKIMFSELITNMFVCLGHNLIWFSSVYSVWLYINKPNLNIEKWKGMKSDIKPQSILPHRRFQLSPVSWQLLTIWRLYYLHQWRTQEFIWGGSTNSVEDRWQTEWESGGGSPLVRGSTQFANEWNLDSD